MATDSFGSGGGFSDFFKQPSWQADAVEDFLAFNQSSNLPKGAFNRTGRGTPDVSALGEGYQVMQGGKVTPAAGTSASTPYFASLISLINDARLQAGKKQLGFLNPWIYKNRHTAFTDITIGSNPDSHEDVPVYGFNCTKGWDPATGVGTPKFGGMLAAAMALP